MKLTIDLKSMISPVVHSVITILVTLWLAGHVFITNSDLERTITRLETSSAQHRQEEQQAMRDYFDRTLCVRDIRLARMLDKPLPECSKPS